MIGLLTGEVGAGKTTVAERVAGLARREGVACGGIVAPALRNACGQKAGIWGIDVATGERRLLARTDRELGGPAVGFYSFDSEAIDWAVATIERATGESDLIFVDEIGKLELWRGEGLAPVLQMLAEGKIECALVIVRKELLDELQARLCTVETTVLEVTEENRDRMPADVLEELLWRENHECANAGKEARPVDAQD